MEPFQRIFGIQPWAVWCVCKPQPSGALIFNQFAGKRWFNNETWRCRYKIFADVNSHNLASFTIICLFYQFKLYFMFCMDLIQLIIQIPASLKMSKSMLILSFQPLPATCPNFVFCIIINIIWLRLSFPRNRLWITDVSARSIFGRWFQEELERKWESETEKGRKPVKVC